MIVVEGPDGSGKTTLAKRMAEDFNLEYRRAPSELLSSREGPRDGLTQWWIEDLGKGEVHRAGGIYDRVTVISEPIYMPVIGRAPTAQPSEYVRMFRQLVEAEPLIIFCLPPWSTQKANLEAKAEEERLEGLDLKKAQRVLWLYYQQREFWTAIAHYGKLRVVTYNWENEGEVNTAATSYLTEMANLMGKRTDTYG